MPADTSVYQRTGRPCWYISYWDPATMKRKHATTRYRIDDPSSHKLALRLAMEKAQASAAFRAAAPAEVWSSWVERYLADRYRGQPKTLQRYSSAWDWWRVYLQELKLDHPAAVRYKHVLGFIDWRSRQRRHCGKLVTRNTALTDLKVFGLIFREAVRRGFAPTNVVERLGLRRDPPAEKPEITDAEANLIRQLLVAREGGLPLQDRWMTITFEIALHHGCRLSETQVPMSAIDLQRGTIRFSAKGKNGVAKVYSNQIHPAIRPLLEKLKETGASITCRHPQMASKEWHLLLKGHPDLKHLCFHSTRVTVITRLARAGVPIQQAMAYVGHASQTVHRIYTRLKAEDLTLCSAALAYPPTSSACSA